jgi:enamine deaminase RidA (YjgF/YER057c/UK114 family)
MSGIDERIEKLGIVLPTRDLKGTGVVDAKLHQDVLYLSAHLPIDENGKAVYVGKVDAEVDIETAYLAARLCGLNMLTTIKDYIGDLDRVAYFVKVLGIVNCSGDFCRQPEVINGFSDLITEVFGRRGQHARSAMGAYALPLNVPVLVDAIVRIR